jgi:hypothetical protein
MDVPGILKGWNPEIKDSVMSFAAKSSVLSRSIIDDIINDKRSGKQIKETCVTALREGTQNKDWLLTLGEHGETQEAFNESVFHLIQEGVITHKNVVGVAISRVLFRAVPSNHAAERWIENSGGGIVSNSSSEREELRRSLGTKISDYIDLWGKELEYIKAISNADNDNGNDAE